MRDRTEVDPDGRKNGEKLGRIEEEETVIRIYYVRKNLFSINEILLKWRHIKQRNM